MVEGSRSLIVKKKPRIILDKRFSVFSELNVRDTGQMIISGVIESERLEEQPDGTELLVKTIRLLKADLLTEKNARQYV